MGCWAPKDQRVALEQTTGRQRMNIHGAFDLETGKARMLDVEYQLTAANALGLNVPLPLLGRADEVIE